MKFAVAKFNKILVVAIILVLAMTAVACNYKPANDPTTGGNSPNQGGSNQGGSSQGGGDSDVYTVTLNRELPSALLVGLKAIWTDMESKNGAYYSASFNKDGVATVTGLDGDYRVTLSSTPEGYTYNPNIYYVNNSSRDVEIALYELLTPDNADTATGLDGYHSFMLSSIGAYRAVFTAENYENGLWFTYKPSSTGTYSVESMIDITQNKLNPKLDVHGGTFAFVTPTPTEESPIDDGGEASTYTKNFRWEIQLKSVGNVYHFRLYAETLDKGVFPLNVDFILDRDGEITGGNSVDREEVSVQHDFNAIAEIAQSGMDGTYKPYAKFDNNNGFLDGSKVYYAGENAVTEEEKKANDYYYVIDSNGNKKILYAKISQDNEVIDAEGKGFLNPLGLPRSVKGKDEETGKTKYYNYVDFIQTYGTHADALNGDGCYPVTKELQLFLQRYSTWQRLFNDGKGMAENNENGELYKSSEKNQWLFACGVYA